MYLHAASLEQKLTRSGLRQLPGTRASQHVVPLIGLDKTKKVYRVARAGGVRLLPATDSSRGC